MHFHKLKIKQITRETNDSVSIEFIVPEELIEDFKYFSGQYLTIKKAIHGQEIRRSYSLCSSPFEKFWKVTVKKVENGLFSTYANENLKEGDYLDVMAPMGNFFIDSTSVHENILLFAAGSGITPIISIAKTILNEGTGNVTLIYGNKGFNEIIFREELESLKNSYMNRFRIIHVFSRESLGNTLQKGRIDEKKTTALFDALLKNESYSKAYICGPQSMIHGVKSSLISRGFENNKIYFELFGTGQDNVTEKKILRDELAAKIEILLDSDMTAFDLLSTGSSILDAAQHFGADLPFACKGGVCCTCKAKVLEGEVEMDVNYALTAEEVENGYVLTCQAHPISNYVKISFDD